jgi:hypothetical protein
MGKVATNGNYTLKGMAERGGVRVAEITLEGKLSVDLSGLAAGGAASEVADAVKTMGMEMKGGAMTGTVWFDPQLGMTREAVFYQDMTLTMKNPTAPEQKLTLPLKQTITQRLLKVEDL